MVGRGFSRFGITMVGLILLGFGAACAQTTPVSIPTNTQVQQLTPYWSPTPSRRAAPQTRLADTSTPPPPPTLTPVTYRVVRGDTMLGIALRYGIRLEDLLAANQEVDPRFLSVDTELIIPPVEKTPEALATPEPLPAKLEKPVCYATSDGGAWCYLLVVNDRSYALENASAWLGIYSVGGEIVVGEIAITPLNLLPAGERMPITVKFPSPLPEDFAVNSDRFSAFIVPEETDRYLETKLSTDEVIILEHGLKAMIKGTVGLREKTAAANLIWLLGVAYDVDGSVVGVRRFELEGTGTADESSIVLEPGESLPFTFEVYSLGPAIENVEVLVEARP